MKNLFKIVLLFMAMTVQGQFTAYTGVIASQGPGGGTPSVDYSLTNAGHANLTFSIDKTVTGVNGEPETIDVANGDFYIAPSGNAYRFTFTEGDVSSIVITADGPASANQSRNMLHWSPDGLAIYTGNFAENVYGEGNGTVPYSTGGRSYLGVLYNLSAQDTDGRGYCYNADGTKIWMLGVVNNTIYEYDVSPAFVGTATNVASFSLAGIGSTPAGLDLSPDGKYIIFGNRNGDSITSIAMTTPGTFIDGGSLDRTLSLNWWTSTPYNLNYSEDGRYIYILDTTKDEIHQVSLNNENDYGPEVIDEPDFASATGWTLGTGWSISGGKATYDGTGGTSSLKFNHSFGTSKRFVMQVTIDSNSGIGTNPMEFGTQRVTDEHVPAQLWTTSVDLTTSPSFFQIYGRSGEVMVLDRLSIKQVLN